MKKVLKISAISLAGLILVVLTAFAIVCYCIFSPQKLTKIVNSKAPDFVTSYFHTERAELTLFKTFPKVGVDLKNTVIKGNDNDSLICLDNLVASIDIKEYLKNNRLIIHDVILENGSLNIVFDENGNPNYDILKLNNDDTTSNNLYIDLKNVKTNNINVKYTNHKNPQEALLKNVNIDASGSVDAKHIDGNVTINAKSLSFMAKNLNAYSKNSDVSFTGTLSGYNILKGKADINIQGLVLHSDTNNIFDSVDIGLNSGLFAAFDPLKIELEDATCNIDDCRFDISGFFAENKEIEGYDMDVDFKTKQWDIDEVLDKIPSFLIGNSLEKLDLHGKIAILGKVEGSYSDSLFPKISSSISVEEGNFAMKDFPLSFQNIDGKANLKLSDKTNADLFVENVSATTFKRNKINAKGSIKNLFGKMLYDISATAKMYISDFSQFLPDDIKKSDGIADFKLVTSFPINPDKSFDIDDLKANIDGCLTNFNFIYQDSTKISSPKLDTKIQFPPKDAPYKVNEWMNAKFSAANIDVKHLDNTTVKLTNANIDAYTNNLTDSTTDLKLGTTFDIGDIVANSDSISVKLVRPRGKFILFDSDHLQLDYSGGLVNFVNGENLVINANSVDLSAKTAYNDKEDNPILQWSPTIDLQLKQAVAQTNILNHELILPTLNLTFNKNNCNLKNVKILFGESDVALNGNISGIESYIKDAGLLKGKFDLTANNLDLNEIIEMVDGFGAPDSLVAQDNELSETKEDAPFIVPFGVDINMKTTIKHAVIEDAEFRNIAGQVYVKDGTLVLEEMGLTNDAARMQLTALYKTPRLNHLFLGFDFHLLDIKIDKLIQMIPDVDTILPMLKAFSGNAEFHFAAETYLKSNYDIKFSTLRGAAAINGHDLVVLDNETYKNISKKLLFNKNTPNKIDSLSTEITIYKNEVDVYPFLLSIDKYQAIISGRHNLDMTYDYNISLIKPVRIGLDIIGMSDRLKYKVGKAKYAEVFVPERKNVVENNILELKSLINKSLMDNVKQ